MNILPKKRWHVRTKENIARVRKDEAEAAAKEKEEQTRIENADREARLNVLKLKAKQKLQEHGEVFDAPTPSVVDSEHEHVNLFIDLERCTTGTNKEHEQEVKNKKEEYEKQIGYLTYLGQDTNEALGKKNWYDVAPESARFARSDKVKETYTKLELRDADGKPRPSSSDTKNGEVSWKVKQALDPIQAFKHLIFKTPVKSARTSETPTEHKAEEKRDKRHKKDKSRNRREEKAEKLRKLREARLRREKEERRRARALLATVSGEPSAPAAAAPQPHKLKPKYNSQFNPELARQNYS